MSAGDLQKKVDTLTRELTEAREQQTATADVLKVISRSTFDVQKVLDTLVESAARLCDAYDALIMLRDGRSLRVRAHYGPIPMDITDWPIGRGSVTGRAFVDRTPTHVHDLQVAAHEFPDGSKAALRLGFRTNLAVPLLRQGDAIGVLGIRRAEMKPFTDKQIELVESFADQAVIAIENTRLVTEQREALERQTATAEVLRVISSFPSELEPVFQAVLANATRLCEASFGVMWLREGQAFGCPAIYGPLPPAYIDQWRSGTLVHPSPHSPLALVTQTRKAVQIPDMRESRSYLDGEPLPVSAVEVGGIRTLLLVPMFKEDDMVGAIAIYRQEVRPFSDKQIDLVANFAAQAVIAIENTRLLNDLNKLNQQLERRVADQVSEIERMSRLRRFLPPQVADLIVASGAEKQLESHRREITALFCDLRGFTGFSEASAPEDVMALLRDYHAAIGEVIIKYSGTLERYAGDGVMVVFNDPVPVDNPALRAVLMALETREAMGALVEKWRQLGHDVGFGIGIAHGFATLGTIGFEGRFDYAAIGTVSNVASRLCDEAKPGQILISPRVFTAVKNAVTVEPMGEFTLKGIGRPLAAYNVLGAKPAN
ncbi:GAF domain-containing protein [Bradyrhizobium sp. RDT10]